MIPFERQQRILELLQDSEILYIDDLVEAIGVSASTVRRDVNYLADAGEVVALRGGAVRVNDRLSELPNTAKVLINKEAKDVVAHEAAALVRDGDTVYIDSGTTPLQVMKYLRGIDCKIVTSNAHVLALPEVGLERVTVLGGDFLPNLGSIVGPMTERSLRELYFDKAFIGTNGISRELGVSTFDMREAAKKRLTASRSRETYVLADHTKFGKSAFCKAMDLADCIIVADQYDELLELAAGYRLPKDETARPEHSVAPAS